MKARGLLGAGLVLALTASAQARSLSISLSAGVFAAGQEAYREIYGPGFSVTFESRYEFKGGLGLSAGFFRLRDKGTAVAVSGGGEDYPLSFERIAVPLTVSYTRRLRGPVLRLGAGLTYHSYREEWRTADLGIEGTCWGPRLCAAVEAPILGRLSLLGSVIYESIATGIRSPLGDKVNLGGLQVLGGISLRVL